MKRTVTIVGRFAFGGLLLAGGIVLLLALVLGFAQGFSRDWTGMLLMLLLYGLLGLAGGAAVGLLAAILDYLIKPLSADKAAPVSETADADPSIWPPAPKPPE